MSIVSCLVLSSLETNHQLKEHSVAKQIKKAKPASKKTTVETPAPAVAAYHPLDPVTGQPRRKSSTYSPVSAPSVESLTPEQNKLRDAHEKRWQDISLSTEPVDFERTATAYRNTFWEVELPWPEHAIIHVQSPVVGTLAAAFTKALINSEDAVTAVWRRGEEWYTKLLADRMHKNDIDLSTDLIDKSIKAIVELSFKAIAPLVPSDLKKGSTTTKNDKEDVSATVTALQKQNWHVCQGIPLWDAWPAYTSFCRDILGMEIAPIARDFEEASEFGGYAWLNTHFIILCERPSEIHITAEGQLHNTTGPALAFRDGWKIYCIEGNPVTEQIVMRPETLTIKDFNDASDEEVRRIMIQQYGWPNYVQLVEAKIIDERENPIDKTHEVLFDCGDRDGTVMICACSSTGRTYPIRVGREVVKCVDAQTWMANLPGGATSQGKCLATS